jgi:cation transport regulator ChaC
MIVDPGSVGGLSVTSRECHGLDDSKRTLPSIEPQKGGIVFAFEGERVVVNLGSDDTCVMVVHSMPQKMREGHRLPHQTREVVTSLPLPHQMQTKSESERRNGILTQTSPSVNLRQRRGEKEENEGENAGEKRVVDDNGVSERGRLKRTREILCVFVCICLSLIWYFCFV